MSKRKLGENCTEKMTQLSSSSGKSVVRDRQMDYQMQNFIKSTNREQIDNLLDEHFVIEFMKTHVLPILSLSTFEVSKCQINALKVSRKGGIAAIEYQITLRHPNGNEHDIISRKFIGKWRRDGQLKLVFDSLKGLWSQDSWQKRIETGESNDDGHLKICEPIAYLPDYNLMLTSKADGLELEIALRENRHDLLETYIVQSAKWLAKLHGSAAVVVQNYFSVQAEEEKLRNWFQHLSYLYPDFSERIQKILHYIVLKERSVDRKYFVFIHGDFHPLNILLDGIDLTVIDFEQSCIFDPAKDLGYFMSYLVMRKEKYDLSIDIEGLQKRFLGKYMDKVSATTETEVVKASVERADVYKARSYIQHLHFRYWTLKKEHDDLYVEDWVSKAEECIRRYV